MIKDVYFKFNYGIDNIREFCDTLQQNGFPICNLLRDFKEGDNKIWYKDICVCYSNYTHMGLYQTQYVQEEIYKFIDWKTLPNNLSTNQTTMTDLQRDIDGSVIPEKLKKEVIDYSKKLQDLLEKAQIQYDNIETAYGEKDIKQLKSILKTKLI